jgi:hypothetical protein
MTHVWNLELASAEERAVMLWLAGTGGGLGWPVNPDWIDMGVFACCGHERACAVTYDLVDRGLLIWGGVEEGSHSWLWIKYDGEYYEPIDWTQETKTRSKRVAALIERDGPGCSYCNCTPVSYEVDHFVPRAKGGEDRMNNLLLACKECNRAKRDSLPEDYLRDRPELFHVLSTNLKYLHEDL